MKKNNNISVKREEKMTIENYIHLIKERLAALPQIIQAIIESDEQFSKKYYDYSVNIQSTDFSVNDDDIIYDVFARRRPKSQIIYLDAIWLTWKQVDNDTEIFKEVKKFIERVYQRVSE